jgi:hypothetical protein
LSSEQGIGRLMARQAVDPDIVIAWTNSVDRYGKSLFERKMFPAGASDLNPVLACRLENMDTGPCE